MAEIPVSCEYDLCDPSFGEASHVGQARNGIHLECWGRAGYELPRLSEIFVPSHVMIHPGNKQEPDSAFRRLGVNIGAAESFSFYEDASRLDAIRDAVETTLPNNLNPMNEDVQAEDEIFMSDSSNCSDKNSAEKPVANSAIEQEGLKLEVTNDVNKDCSLNLDNSKTKDVAVMNWLQNNDFETNRPANQVHVVSKPCENDTGNLKMPMHECINESKFNEKNELILLNHIIDQNKSEDGSGAIANYAVGKKLEKEEDLISSKSLSKKSKNRKKLQNKEKKNKNNPMSLAELQMSMNDENSFQNSNGQEVDELQLYYAQGYYRSKTPICNQADFPQLPASDFRSEEKMKSISPPPTKLLPDFKSLAKSLIADTDSNQKESRKTNQNTTDICSSGCEILMIENLPQDLSSVNLRSFLEDYGQVCDISVSRVGAKLTAAVTMDCDLEWVAELLHGNSISGDSGPLNCYVKKRNVR